LALEALTKARHAFNLNCAGVAHACSSLAARQLGDEEAAQGYLDQAESHYQRLLEGNADRLSRHWHRAAMFELLLAEARTAVKQP
jgi:hypothetical protein